MVLILVGAPGSGKSTFCEALPKNAWTAINQDTIGNGGKKGNRKQCLAAMRRALDDGKHVAIDRCGMDEAGVH
jgi:aprataxin